MTQSQTLNGTEIAVIGMSGRFPGAADLCEFWRNLRDGVHSISFFSDEELQAAGVSRELMTDPRFVRAGGVLDAAEWFDASFFGFSAREAEIMDPQQRVLLETAWEALERAGYDSERYEGAIGVYAGVAHNTYLYHLLANPEIIKSAGTFQLVIGSEKDFVAPRISYKLNLNGPSVVVQTACSTSLVAVHLACQALLAGECQIALAGGVAITFPQTTGYLYQEGGVNAPDGFCRAFDARAHGTVASRGVGIVVLKLLETALADGDHVHAVIKGSAINNDGAVKAGFTAPGVEGQARVVRAAQVLSNVEPDTIGYVEAHGTGTPLGDPIEITALTRAFRVSTARKQFCAIGSLKTNIGHLDTAAGVAGLIKAVLALENRQIPPSLHFEQPNPAIRFEESPFYVNAKLSDWPANGVPRRAAVSSFGIGGTNAHVVLEEAPKTEPSGPARSSQLLLLSARTESALETMTDRLAAHLEEHHEQNLADIAFTTQMGRRTFAYRRIALCGDQRDAASTLAIRDPRRVLSRHSSGTDASAAFLFPGQGTQYVNMAHGLFVHEPVFRRWIEQCSDRLAAHLQLDLLQILYPPSYKEREATEQLLRTELTQPALFVVEYSLARLWMEWGVVPRAMLGHSIGEYVAACLAGVMDLDDALLLVAARGRLMQRTEPGAMLALPLPESEVSEMLDPDLRLAAVNGPCSSVVAGTIPAIEALETHLAQKQVIARRLHTSHAFHSHLMEPILEEFGLQFKDIRLHPPGIPFVSDVTGTWITNAQATSPDYWVQHLRNTVRFGDGLSELFRKSADIMVEAGPGSVLSRLATSHPAKSPELAAIPSIREAHSADSDEETLLMALGRVWLSGCRVDWTAFHAQDRRRRVPLPTYPFERQRYWINGASSEHAASFSIARAEASVPDVTAEPTTPRGPHIQTRHPRPDLSVSYVAPRNETEQRVIALWEELLGIEPVGIYDNFFELGGHSLLAAQMASGLKQRFNTDLPLKRIFETPTGIAQAALIARCQATRELSTADADNLPVLVPDPMNRYEPFAMTDIQQAYWIGRSGSFALGQVATHAYVEVEERNLDLGRLTRAWQALIDRHDMLRAVFLPDGRQQILRDIAPYHIETQDLRGIDSARAESMLLFVRERMSHQVLPAHRWPLFELRASLRDGNITRVHFSFDLLIGDAWSWRILMFELLQFYHEPSLRLPPLELSFRDYVQGVQALQSTQIFERSLQYWQSRLEFLPPAPDLPVSRSFANLMRPVFRRHAYRLPTHQWQLVKAQATRSSVTPTVVLLTAFSEVLARWCRNPRFTVNLTLFNRLPLHPEVNRLVGDFTSLTLLAVDFTQMATFEARARQIQAQLFDDLDHRYVSAVQVLRELARLRPGSRTMMPVVFTSTLALQEKPPEGLPEERVFDRPDAVVYSISQTPQVLLDHQVGEQDGDLVVNWDAVEEAFPAGMLEDIFGAYCDLLKRLASDHEVWQQSGIDLLPNWQVEQAVAVNATSAVLPVDLLHAPVAQHAEKQPDRPAVIWAGGLLTYQELDQRANRLARRLRKLRVRPNHLVAVLMEKSWEQVVAVLAILRAGAAYLPIDPSLPEERRLFLLKHSDVEVTVTRRAAGRTGLPAGVTEVAVNDSSLLEEDDAALDSIQGLDDLAYVIFTSGSTGIPKGVMIQHRGASNTVLDVNQRYAIGAEDRVLALSALNFDLSVYDIFGLLAAGGAIVLPDPDKLRDPGHWLDLMIRTNVTVWNSVPALMQMQADYLQGKGGHLPESLRVVMMSGDWIPTTLPNQIRQLGDGIHIFSMGGATEASIWSIDYRIADVDPSWPSIPYGKPMLNQTFHVLNSRLQSCPVWTPGDLFIGGVGLAAGYWKDQEKTSASFILHPVSGERLYRTGDLGRWLPGGNIEFLGREDFQVKVQGHRIELGEIEAALVQHPALKLAVVSAFGERQGNKRLVAHVVFQEGESQNCDRLESFLREKLPAYMVPSAFVPLLALPLTANGKVDRSALPPPGQSMKGQDEQVFVPSRDLVEFELCEIWKQVLGLGQVGVRDNFFQVGGHSVLAVRLMAQVERRIGIDLPLSTLFEHPTIEEMADMIRSQKKSAPQNCLVPVQPKGSRPAFFWVHPMGGTVFCYAPLARSLGMEQPFFAFQSRDHESFSSSSESECSMLEEMASEYCDELRRFQRAGPYFLGGWSMGGIIAFEMARQLRIAGEEIAHLVIVDALAPVPDVVDKGSFETVSVLAFAHDLGVSPAGLNANELIHMDPSMRFARIFERARAEGIVSGDDFIRVSRLFENSEHNRQALAGYRGKSYEGNIVLLRASESHGPSGDPWLGWRQLVQEEIELHVVPGNHFSILNESSVHLVAKILTASIPRVHTRK